MAIEPNDSPAADTERGERGIMSGRTVRLPDDIPCPGTRLHEDWLKYLLEDGKRAVRHRDHWHVVPTGYEITGGDKR